MIAITREELVAAFEQWDRNHRENPHKFLHYTQVMQMTPHEAAEAATDYLIELLPTGYDNTNSTKET